MSAANSRTALKIIIRKQFFEYLILAAIMKNSLDYVLFFEFPFYNELSNGPSRRDLLACLMTARWNLR